MRPEIAAVKRESFIMNCVCGWNTERPALWLFVGLEDQLGFIQVEQPFYIHKWGWPWCGDWVALRISDAEVRFRTDARTENWNNWTVGSGSVQFGPQILGCQFGSRFYDFLNFENWVWTGSNRTFCTYFFLIFLLRIEWDINKLSIIILHRHFGSRRLNQSFWIN